MENVPLRLRGKGLVCHDPVPQTIQFPSGLPSYRIEVRVPQPKISIASHQLYLYFGRVHHAIPRVQAGRGPNQGTLLLWVVVHGDHRLDRAMVAVSFHNDHLLVLHAQDAWGDQCVSDERVEQSQPNSFSLHLAYLCLGCLES